MKKKSIKLAALLLGLLMILTMLPMTAFAGGSVNIGEIKGEGVDTTKKTIKAGSTVYVEIADLSAAFGEDIKPKLDDGSVYCVWRVGETDIPASYTSGKAETKLTVTSSDVGKEVTFFVNSRNNENSYYNNNTSSYLVISSGSSSNTDSSIDIKIDSKGIATITGKTTGSETFKNLYASNNGNRWILAEDINTKEFSVTYDTKKLEIGYHDLWATLTDNTEVIYPKAFPTAIYEKPALKASFFETYSTKLAFSTPNHDGYKYDYILQMKKPNQTWEQATTFESFGPNTAKAIKKLTANTKYNFRAVYTKKVTYGGKDYYMVGPFSKVITVKTGPKAKPAVASVTTSKASVKDVWVKPILNALGLVEVPGYWVKETTYKVTVNFKKKPGVYGVWIWANGNSPLFKFVKGNKKSYSATFTLTGSNIGKKIKVKVYTQGNKSYGAYSPTYTKKKVPIRK